MNARVLKEKFVSFFLSKQHIEIPSASLVPENDPSTLFISAGMHPLVPYLIGQPHPLGKRLVDVQKCVRTGDIDEVGDGYHHTFFEMLGNWSLGDYFKKDMIPWSFEFLTKELKIDIKSFHVTCFEGDSDAPKDTESHDLWFSLGVPEDHIHYLPKHDNWWGPAGTTGPCGPDTEMFIDTNINAGPIDFVTGCKQGRIIEIWNDVFMQYNKDESGKFVEMSQKNVDTGLGVERNTAILSGFADNYLSTIWQPIIKKIEELSKISYVETTTQKSIRIIADHLRSAVFIIADGVDPSNKDRGYVLRRLIRRAIRQGKMLGINHNFTSDVAQAVIDNQDNYAGEYPELNANIDRIFSVLDAEENKFRKTLEQGLREIQKNIPNLTISSELVNEIAIIKNHLSPDVDYIKKISEDLSKEYIKNKNAFEAITQKLLPNFESINNIAQQLSRDVSQYSHLAIIKNQLLPDFNHIKKISEDLSKEYIKNKDAFEAIKQKIQNDLAPIYQLNNELTKNYANQAFKLYESFGFPLEMITEELAKNNLSLNIDDFNKAKEEHQKLSQTLSAGKFKSGLADNSEIITKYHTATHLLHAALRKVLGDHVQQSGSNITSERLRFDFSHPERLTQDELEQVENLVNQKISEKLPVIMETMKYTDAIKSGALAFFGSKYPEIVSVYTIGLGDNYFSKEVCTGPHVSNTSELVNLKITKEESAGSGKRRIYAVISES